jgi:hypothetical protein
LAHEPPHAKYVEGSKLGNIVNADEQDFCKQKRSNRKAVFSMQITLS